MTTRQLLLLIMLLPHAVIAQEQEGDMLMMSIYFGGGSYYVDRVQSEDLKKFIEDVDKLENYEVVIFSHTDNIGGKEYNEWLSKMRSSEVYDIIQGIPVPEEQIKIRDFGMSNPMYTNKNHHGRRANRRVDVILMPIVF